MNGDVETENCNLLDCCDPLPWTEWGTCTATCFTGRRTRSHGWTCDYKAEIVVSEVCDAGPGTYSLWSNWGACSQTCSGGFHSRNREHSCGLTDHSGRKYALSQSESCGFEGSWSQWTDYSTCSSSCPGGQMTRTRQHECSGKQTKFILQKNLEKIIKSKVLIG